MKAAVLACGGGSKGANGAGALQALKDSGIEIGAYFGASVGSLNSLLAFQGRWDEIKDLWMHCNNSWIYNKYWFKGAGKISMYDTAPLRKLIESKTDLTKIRANKDQKFFISVTDFTTNNSLAFEINELADDEVVDILLASASPPVFFPPVNFKGKQLVDAGVADNFGLTKAINEGYDTLFVIKYPQSQPKPIKNKLDALTNTISAAMDSDYNKELNAIKKINQIIDHCDDFDPSMRKIDVIEIVSHNPKELDYDFLDFDFKGRDRMSLWYSGYEAAMIALEKHGYKFK